MDQLSIIVRYVEVTPGNEICVRESFLGFFHVKDQGAEGITGDVLQFLQDKGIDIRKCRGQGMDGAAVNSGAYSGIQARIKEYSPTADFVHCFNHNLNLVLNDSVNDIAEIRNFYAIVNELYVFFSVSLPRWDLLHEAGFKNNRGNLEKLLKKLCPTRWSSRIESVSSLKLHFSSVAKALPSISLISGNKKAAGEAAGLLKSICTFELVLMLVFQYKVLNIVHHVANQLHINISATC